MHFESFSCLQNRLLPRFCHGYCQFSGPTPGKNGKCCPSPPKKTCSLIFNVRSRFSAVQASVRLSQLQFWDTLMLVALMLEPVVAGIAARNINLNIQITSEPTQPGHPSVGRHYNYRQKLGRNQTHRAMH